jgi:hypothetical protein
MVAKRTFAVLTFGFLATLLASELATAGRLDGVQVVNVSYQGDGCPQGSVQTAFAPNVSEFSILYSALTMNVGGPTGQTTDSRGCEVQIRLKVPFGYTINVESADFRGFVSLDGGVMAQHSVEHQVGTNRLATYGFGTQLFVGPRSENYLIRSQKPNLQLPRLLQCLPLRRETTLSVRTHIKMTGGETSHLGLLAVDSADGKIEQKYSLSLKRCF